MATSGNYVTTIRTGYQLKLLWEVTSQNVANNTSAVTVKAQLISTGSSYTINSSVTKNGTLTINGTSYDFTFSAALSGNQTKTIVTKSVTVSHNSDGTKSCAFKVSAGINVTLGGTYYGTVTASGTGTFNAIPRASKPTLSASSVEMGKSLTITTNRASSAFTHTLSYTFGSLSGTIASNVGASYAWTIPLSLANAIPSGTSGSGTITCKTYSGSTLIGTSSVSFKATVPASVIPSISKVTISEAVSGIAAKFGGYIQHKSQLKVAITAAGSYKSTISKYQTTIQSVNYSGSSFTSNVITANGTIAVKTTVTDSRGRTATATNNVTVLAYSLPKITTFKAFRCDTNGNENPDGTRLKVELNFSISSVNNKNDKYYEVVYRKKDSNESWGAIASGNIYSRNESFISGSYFNVDYAYDLALQLYDYFGGARAEIDIPTAFTLMDFKGNGKGIAFGKVAEKDDLIDFGMPVSFSNSNWIDLTLDSNFKSYNDINENRPKYKAIGEMVMIRGIVSPKMAYTSSTTTVVFASGIPAALRPSINLQYLCQGSGNNKWLLTVGSNGNLSISRYGISSNVEIPNTAWLPFMVTYFV